MRESLRHHLGAAIRGGHVGRLARIGVRVASERLGIPLPPPLRGPLLATFAVTWRCPLRCEMCNLPARAAGELSDDALIRWVDAIADMGPAGLGFTGGEPLLRKGVIAAMERAVARGLVTHLNTSGVPLTSALARRVVDTGAQSVNISVDHADKAIHDLARGRAGAFDSAMVGLEHLAAARAQAGAKVRLQVVMAVDHDSLRHVEALRQDVLARGGDALSLLPIHHFESPTLTAAAVPRSVVQVAPDRDRTGRAQADPRGGTLSDLENSDAYLAGILPFLDGTPTPTACSAPRTAVFVDPRGHLFACTPASTERQDGIAATPESFSKIVRSGALTSTVPEGRCSSCWWNCHRELDVAIGTLRRPFTDRVPAPSSLH